MKINLRQIPQEGLILKEEIPAERLELNTENIKFSGPITVTAEVSRITNTVIAKLSLQAKADVVCSRCLGSVARGFDKKMQLEYLVESADQSTDLNPDIRQEIILDYPIKFLCRPDCLGLCLECGGNLNQGKCGCKDLKVKIKSP